MWIRLKKSHTSLAGKKMPIGQVLNLIRSEAKKLIQNNTAEPYNGKMPPDKVKTEFFKPKNENKKWQQQEQ